MTVGTDTAKIYRGLKGVYLDRSAATFIDGRAGELPTRAELDAFDAELKAASRPWSRPWSRP